MARYVFTDLHGRYDLWQQIKDFITPEDEVYCLGDCNDRGPDGFRIIKEVLDTSNIIYIKGNHEDLLVDAYKHGNYSLWYLNGGKYTRDQIQEYFSNDEVKIKDFVNLVAALPTRIDLDVNDKHIILTHAGINPWVETTEVDYIWDRHHIAADWEDNYDNTYIIHGHTPTVITDYRPEQFELISAGIMDEECGDVGIIKYANGHKINLDIGAVWEDAVALFNLDTFEVKYFYV